MIKCDLSWECQEAKGLRIFSVLPKAADMFWVRPKVLILHPL